MNLNTVTRTGKPARRLSLCYASAAIRALAADVTRLQREEHQARRIDLERRRSRQSQGRTRPRQRLECVELAPAFVPPAALKAPASWTHSRRFAAHDASRHRRRAGKPELILARALSGHEQKYGDAGGEGFFARTRRERGAYPPRYVTSEQRCARRSCVHPGVKVPQVRRLSRRSSELTK